MPFGGSFWQELKATKRIFDDAQVPMVDALLEYCDKEGRPDVLVTDIATTACYDVAELLHVPLAVCAAGPLGLLLEVAGLGAYNSPLHVPYEGFMTHLPEAMTPLQRYVIGPLLKLLSPDLFSLMMRPGRNARRKPLGLPPLGWRESVASVGDTGAPVFYLISASWHLNTKRTLPPNWHLLGCMGADFTSAAGYPPALAEGPVRDFLDAANEAGECVLYVATGSLVVLKAEQVAAMAAAFLQLLPHTRVLWAMKEKTQAFVPPQLASSPRCMLQSWVAQAAVLAQPCVSAFVTHGGMNSINEGLAAGKPLMVLPFGGDQPINAQHVVNRGFGFKADPQKLQPAKLAACIRCLLDDTTYTKRAAAVGAELRQQSGPAEAARLIAGLAGL